MKKPKVNYSYLVGGLFVLLVLNILNILINVSLPFFAFGYCIGFFSIYYLEKKELL